MITAITQDDLMPHTSLAYFMLCTILIVLIVALLFAPNSSGAAILTWPF